MITEAGTLAQADPDPDAEYPWMGPPGLPNNENGELDVLDRYHGDFKHRKREELEGCGCGLKH